MNAIPTASSLLRRIRLLTAFFIFGLVMSGVTAIPLQSEMQWLLRMIGAAPGHEMDSAGGLVAWLWRVYAALAETNVRHPFLAYGFDWLAFAHFVIAVAFIGAWRDPVRNRWLFDFGLIACAMVIPFALVAGHFRGIPPGWRMIDCSFGICGAIPLILCRKWAIALENEARRSSNNPDSNLGKWNHG